MADVVNNSRVKPSAKAIFKAKSKHKSLFAFLHREKSSLRRSPRLQNKENEPVILKRHSSLQDLNFGSKTSKKNTVSKQEKKKSNRPHQPIIKQHVKGPSTREQRSLKRMRSSSISLHNLEAIKPAKRIARDTADSTLLISEQTYQENTLNRQSFRSSIHKVVSFATKFSPRTSIDGKDSHTQSHDGEFARPTGSPVHNFIRQGSKKYKQLPTPIRRRPSKLWIDTVGHSINNVHDMLSPLQIKRQEAIFELHSGEDDMIEDLRLLREAYFNPMATLGLIEEQQLQQLFGFIEILLPLHEGVTPTEVPFLYAHFTSGMTYLSTKLRQLKNDQEMIEDVGKVLLEWVATLRPYISYCAKQVQAKDTLDQILKEDNSVADFLQRCRESPFSRKLDLWSFIDAPRGRLVKYPLLFTAIRKLTLKTHPDRFLLQRAIYEMERIIAEADSETGRCKCEHVRNQLYFLDPQHACIVNQAVSLSCSGVLRNKNGSKLHVFLFDNVLVMSRPATRQGRMMFQVSHQPIDITSLSLEDLPDGEVKIGGSFKNTLTKNQCLDKHLFRICVDSSPQKRLLTFQALDDHDKKQWVKNFNSVLSKKQKDSIKTRICFDQSD